MNLTLHGLDGVSRLVPEVLHYLKRKMSNKLSNHINNKISNKISNIISNKISKKISKKKTKQLQGLRQIILIIRAGVEKFHRS